MNQFLPRKLWLPLHFLLWIWFLGNGEIWGQAYKSQVYNITEGLAQSQVTAIMQDRRGYMWFGTESGGVSRFDGRNFETFNTEDGMLSNGVHAIAEDPAGNIWFGCERKGLCWYDGYRFRSFIHNSSLSFARATEIIFIGREEMWLSTLGDGLYHITRQGVTHLKDADGIYNDSAFCVIPRPNGEVWVGTPNGIVAASAQGVHPLDPAQFPLAPTEYVRSFAEMSSGKILGATGDHIWYFDGKQFSVAPDPDTITSINDVREDRSGNLWIAGDQRTVRVTREGPTRLGRHDGLKEVSSTILYEDRNNNMWLGTNGGGVICFTPAAFENHGEDTPLQDRAIFALCELAPQHLLIGTERGLYQIKQGQVSSVPGFRDQQAMVMAFERDNEGNALILTRGKGIFLYDGKSFQLVNSPPKEVAHNVTNFFRGRDGSIMIPGAHGIYRIKGKELEKVDFPGLEIDTPESGFAYQDRKGRLWLYFARQGLMRWENGVVKRFGVAEGFSESVFEIDEDRNGAIWLSTGGGLYRFIDDEYCYLSTVDGMSGNVVYLNQQDHEGRMWAGTENGLTRITLDEHSDPTELRIYGKAEGFTGIECNQGASVEDSQHDIWFGTIGGLVCYHPEADIIDTIPPNILINDFRADVRGTNWQTAGFATSPWTHVPIDPVLQAGDDYVRIAFAGITQRFGDRVKYIYQLEGLEEGYSEPTTENFRIYSPLPAGEYTFKVKACNADGVWSREPAVLHFEIPERFYRTTWFGVLCFVLFGGLIAMLVSARTRNLQRQRSLLEIKVRQRTEALEQANQVKGEFLAKMSHEIRTPMNGVIGMTDLLDRTSLTVQQRKFVDNIRVSGQNLLNLINDILDFSRIESGKLELEDIPFDLRTMMEEVMDILSFSAFSKGLEILYWVDPEIRGPITGDPGRIKQILTNLLGNAIKFTAAGDITLRAVLVATEGNKVTVKLSVRDSGIGIPKEKHATLFESFTQVDASTTRKYGGTGLGLAISYNLARMMGGEMWVESEPGQGAEFFFTIQAGTSGPWRYLGDAHPAKSLEGKKVVMAIGHKGTQNLVAEYLGHWGVELQSFSSVEAATDAALDQKDIMFLIIDVRLIHGDPSVLVHRLETMCRQTGLRFGLLAEPDVSLWIQSKMGDQGWVLPKPLKRDDLLHALMGHRYGLEAQPNRDNLALLAQRVPLRILIAEDNPINQDVALGMLSSLGYQAQVAHDGREAVEVAMRGQLDLIFMDVQMPEMDGITATRHIIAQMPKDQRPLIIAMTANAMESDRQRCLEAGMDGFISKPFMMSELMRTLQSLEGLRAGTPLPAPEQSEVAPPPAEDASRDTPSPQTPPVEPPAPPANSSYRYTDMTMLESVSGGEPAFVLGILSKLVVKLPEAVAELRAAAEKEDWETVRATAHRNKSSSAYSGSDLLRDKFKDLEHQARERVELETIPARLDELAELAAAVVEELQRHIAERSK